jgi:hypothetical protein
MQQVFELAHLVAAIQRTARFVVLDEHRVPFAANADVVAGHRRRQRRERQDRELRSQAREPAGQVIRHASDRAKPVPKIPQTGESASRRAVGQVVRA